MGRAVPAVDREGGIPTHSGIIGGANLDALELVGCHDRDMAVAGLG
jgi:hypothetical protein